MIASRFAAALRDRDWITVAVEFFIVMLSVVAGLQVTAWNEARQSRNEARFLTSEIAREAEETVALLDGELSYGRHVRDATLRAYTLLREGGVTEANRAAFEQDLLGFNWAPDIRVHRAALDAFAASSDLQEATPRDLRERIRRFHERLDYEQYQSQGMVGVFTEAITDIYQHVDAAPDYTRTGALLMSNERLNNHEELARALYLIHVIQVFEIDRMAALRDAVAEFRQDLPDQP